MSGKNVLGRVLTVLGAVLILAALSLVLYNYRHEHESKKTMDNVLVRLDNEIPDEPQKEEASPFDVFDADDGYSDDSTAEVSDEDESLSLDGDEYIGIISLPALDREYPILKYWSYPNMNIAPCRYDGIRAGRDLIICGHNYAGFFDNLSKLNSGDEIIFTDIKGRKFIYEVSYTELIDGWDTDSMYIGARQDWDLTLFTCTWSGYSRVTVRAVLSEQRN